MTEGSKKITKGGLPLGIATRNMISRTTDITHDNVCTWVVSAEWWPFRNLQSSLKFYLRKTVDWPLFLHVIFVMFVKNDKK